MQQILISFSVISMPSCISPYKLMHHQYFEIHSYITIYNSVNIYFIYYKFKLNTYTSFVNNYAMSLKQHNDIVQKLLKQLQVKQKQLQSLKKQLNKTNSSVHSQNSQKSKLIQLEKQHTRKITQLHKQYKDKITTIAQQARSKSIENKDLKERLTTLKNIEVKEKQQISQILKKSANIAAYDPKFAAVVSHYESELQRKDKYITNLQKQIKQNYYEKNNKNKSQNTLPVNNQVNNQEQQENIQPIHENQTQKIVNNQHFHTKYQQEINMLKLQNNKCQRLLEEKNKQFKDLTKRYSQLTKDYYKIMNEYQCTDLDNKKTNKGNKFNIGNKSEKNFSKNKNNTSGTGIGSILDEMVQKFTEQPSQSDPSHTETSLSYSFLSNLGNKPIQSCPQTETELKILQDLIQNILQLFQIQNRIQIIPTLTKLKNKIQQMETYQNIAKYIHEMLYRMGMGKIGISQICYQLQKFQRKINKYQECSQLLDEICIQIGAKKQKVMDKIKDFKATQQQFFTNMKDVNFMQQLPKANKIIQFIQYFQLDRQACTLPDQLRKMYEQLKYVDRFIKQTAVILQKQPQGLQRSLQSILRYLQRKQAEQNLKNTQKSINKKNKII